MKHLKTFNQLNESMDTKYVLVTYDKTVDGYPEKTAIIVNNDKIIDSIDLLFNRGEYSEEAKNKMSKYNISGKTVADEEKDLYMVGGIDITQEEALKLYLNEIETVKRINKFLTPEKEEELINLFKKRK